MVGTVDSGTMKSSRKVIINKLLSVARNRIQWLAKELAMERVRAHFLGPRVTVFPDVRIGKRNIIRAHKGGIITLMNQFATCRDVEIIAYSGAGIVLERNTYIGHGSTLAAHRKITIGENTSIADLVSIRDHNHGFGKDIPPWECPGIIKPITIGKNCWLGAKVTIVAGVELGNNVVVGANSVVTKSFGSNLVIGGCPAKIIRQL